MCLLHLCTIYFTVYFIISDSNILKYIIYVRKLYIQHWKEKCFKSIQNLNIYEACLKDRIITLFISLWKENGNYMFVLRSMIFSFAFEKLISKLMIIVNENTQGENK